MTILEAMSCGLPVVSTPVGGVPDAVNEKQIGVLSKGVSAQEFEEALLIFLNKN